MTCLNSHYSDLGPPVEMPVETRRARSPILSKHAPSTRLHFGRLYRIYNVFHVSAAVFRAILIDFRAPVWYIPNISALYEIALIF
jgi:hypothetical protein